MIGIAAMSNGDSEAQHGPRRSKRSSDPKRRASRAAFGREVRRRRLAQGLTLEALAELSGLTANYIGGVEVGKREPSLSTLLAIAKGLRVEAGELVAAPHGLSLMAYEAALLFERCSPEVQEAVVLLLQAFTSKPTR